MCSTRGQRRTCSAFRPVVKRPTAATPISAKTLEHYDQRAEEFREGTRDHDVRQNVEALLRHIRSASPFSILDFGCGPGRDLAAFRALGHEPVGLEELRQWYRR